MTFTDYHAKYLAHELTKRCSSDSMEKPPALSSITNSRQAAIQRTISERNARFFEAQDKVDQQREDLIANIEGKLQQRASLIELFTVRWCLV